MIKVSNKRHKAVDFWIYIARTLAITGWLLFICAMLISYYAAPETDFGIYRYLDIGVRTFWLTPLTGYFYLVLLSSALSSYFCLVIENYRSRRKTDNTYFNMFLLMLIAVAWLSYILVDVRG